jgi:phosphate transport system permease protein
MSMRKQRWQRRTIIEQTMHAGMILALLLVVACLTMILWTILSRGMPALSWEMVSQAPKGGFYTGKGGGVLNAIIGSLLLATGGTILAALVSIPIALYIHTYLRTSRWAQAIRFALDVLWGIPSIVYGAFGFSLMIALGMRASLLAGIIALCLVELPIMTRAMDEVIRRLSVDLEHAALALGSTQLEVATRVIVRQTIPGLLTAVLLAFGRGIGDAAAVLYTAGFTDRITTSLLRPTASLPLAIFFQLSSPIAAVRARGYASALILTIIVLCISFGARWASRRLNRYTLT